MATILGLLLWQTLQSKAVAVVADSMATVRLRIWVFIVVTAGLLDALWLIMFD
jgi:hypothetical protein